MSWIEPVLKRGFQAVGLDLERADVPGLWRVPGYPELTERQMIKVAGDTGALRAAMELDAKDGREA